MAINYTTARAKIFNNVADMSTAAGIENNDVAITRGYSSAGVGAGIYRYVAGDSTTANGGFIITHTGGRWHLIDQSVYDVLQWGAVGDGATNDTAAIQACINATKTHGATVYFPAGRYLMDSVNIPPRYNLTIKGDGRGPFMDVFSPLSDPNSGTVIYCPNSGGGFLITRNASTAHYGIRFTDFAIRSNTYTGVAAFRFNTNGQTNFCSNFIWERIGCVYFQYGILVEDTGSSADKAWGLFKIYNSIIKNNKCIIKTNNGTRINHFVFDGNDAGNNSDSGLVYREGAIDIGGSSILITNNILEGQNNPVKLDTCDSGITVKNNHFEQITGDYIIYIRHPANCTIDVDNNLWTTPGGALAKGVWIQGNNAPGDAGQRGKTIIGGYTHPQSVYLDPENADRVFQNLGSGTLDSLSFITTPDARWHYKPTIGQIDSAYTYNGVASGPYGAQDSIKTHSVSGSTSYLDAYGQLTYAAGDWVFVSYLIKRQDSNTVQPNIKSNLYLKYGSTWVADSRPFLFAVDHPSDTQIRGENKWFLVVHGMRAISGGGAGDNIWAQPIPYNEVNGNFDIAGITFYKAANPDEFRPWIPFEEMLNGNVKVFANVAEMQAAALTSNAIYNTLGYLSSGIGSNSYRFIPGDTTTADGGFVISHPSGRIHAMDKTVTKVDQFGARSYQLDPGSGYIYSHTEIQAAIDAVKSRGRAMKVVFEQPFYAINDELVVNEIAGIEFCGVGGHRERRDLFSSLPTIFQNNPAKHGIYITQGAVEYSTVRCNGIALVGRNLYVHTKAGIFINDAISFNGWLDIDRSSIHQFKEGITNSKLGPGVGFIQVVGSNIEQNLFGIDLAYQVNAVVIRDSIIRQNGNAVQGPNLTNRDRGAGIRISNSAGLTIDSCDLEACPVGIDLQTVTGFKISACYGEVNPTMGMFLKDCRGGEITGNYLGSFGVDDTDVIYMQECQDVIVQGNRGSDASRDNKVRVVLNHCTNITGNDSEYLFDIYDGSYVGNTVFTVDPNTDIFTMSNHRMGVGQNISFLDAGGLPSPLVSNTNYYVRDVTPNTFKISSTSGGGPLDITTSGIGENKLWKRVFSNLGCTVNEWERVKKISWSSPSLELTNKTSSVADATYNPSYDVANPITGGSVMKLTSLVNGGYVAMSWSPSQTVKRGDYVCWSTLVYVPDSTIGNGNSYMTFELSQARHGIFYSYTGGPLIPQTPKKRWHLVQWIQKIDNPATDLQARLIMLPTAVNDVIYVASMSCEVYDTFPSNPRPQIQTLTQSFRQIGDKEWQATAIPSSSMWRVGDRVNDVAPTAGGFEGWMCTTSGNPGTWKTRGAITA